MVFRWRTLVATTCAVEEEAGGRKRQVDGGTGMGNRVASILAIAGSWSKENV